MSEFKAEQPNTANADPSVVPTEQVGEISDGSDTVVPDPDSVAGSLPLPRATLNPTTYYVVQALASDPRAARYFNNRIGRNHSSNDQDARQEALLRFITRHREESPPSDDPQELWPWFYGFAARTVAEHYRQEGKNQSKPVADLPERPDRGSVEETVVNRLAYGQVLREAFASLSPQERSVMELIALDPSRKAPEIAGELGMTPDAVRVAKSRARAKLRRYLQPYLSDDPTPIPAEQPKSVPAARKHTQKKPPQAKAVAAVRDLHKGGRFAMAVIPEHLGPLLIAGNELMRFIKNADEQARALVVYPHFELTRTLLAHIGLLKSPWLQDGRLELIMPEAVAGRLKRSRFEYTVGIGELHEDTLARIRRASTFFLHISTKASASSGSAFAEGRYCTAPGYSSGLAWTPKDSVRYLKEYWLMQGDTLTPERVQARAEQRAGPSLQQLCRGIGSFAALQEMAGYPVA